MSRCTNSQFFVDAVDGLLRARHWSPYGCHYHPDPDAFPPPNIDTLPPEPLQRGEQYYLDLGGTIRKGPVGVGYTCYCAPLFRHLEARLARDKRALRKAHLKLGQRVAGLEQKLFSRGGSGEGALRRSERVSKVTADVPVVSTLLRSRSLEMLLDEKRAKKQQTAAETARNVNNDGDDRLLRRRKKVQSSK